MKKKQMKGVKVLHKFIFRWKISRCKHVYLFKKPLASSTEFLRYTLEWPHRKMLELLNLPVQTSYHISVSNKVSGSEEIVVFSEILQESPLHSHHISVLNMSIN